MRRCLTHSAVAAACGAAILIPRTTHAFGLGYGYEFAQAKFEADPGLPHTKVEWPTHRLALVDTTGRLATLFASAAATDYERTEQRSDFAIYTTETWTGRYVPMSAGTRVVISYAWSGAEVDAQREGGPVERQKLDFSEFRLQLGGLVPMNPLYVDLDVVDLIWRDMSGPAKIDRFQWNLNAEVGGMFGPLRAGPLLELDLVSAVDAAFDGRPFAWVWGFGAHFDARPLIVSFRWRSFTLATDDRGGTAKGRALMAGASLEY